MRKILLLLGLVTLGMSAQAQISYFSNDTCGGAYRLCSNYVIPIGKTTFNQTNSNGVTLSCGALENRSVWFLVEGWTGGTANVTIDDVDDSMDIEVFSGGCGALTPVGGTCLHTGGNSGGTVTTSWTVTGTTQYWVMVNTPAPFTGEAFTISISSPDSAVIGAPSANFNLFPDPPVGCDTVTNNVPNSACIEFTNVSTERGGVVEYYWDIDDGNGFVLDPLAAVGKKDTFCFSPAGRYDVELKACNECQTELPAGGTQSYCDIDLASIRPTAVFSLKISPTFDTTGAGICAGTPIAFVAQATMTPNPIIPPDVTYWKWRFYQPGGYVGGLLNNLDPCYTVTMIGDTVEVLDTCVLDPSVAGPDTIWYTPHADTNILWVEMVANGNCAPDSLDRTYTLKEKLEIDAYDDTLTICDGDTSDYLCGRIISDTSQYPAPFTYKWYDSAGALVDSFVTSTIDICVPGPVLKIVGTAYEAGPIPFAFEIWDDNGCVGRDTMQVMLCKPRVDTILIGNLSDTTATCSPDTNAVVLCTDFTVGAYCPGDSVMIVYTVRGKPPLTLNWSPTTGLSDHETSWPTDSLTDTAWVQSRSITTDFMIQLIVEDSLMCTDTMDICLPFHEPPILTPPDSTCVTAITDSLFIGVEGTCSGSTFDWNNLIPGGRHNNLLVSMGAPDSVMFFDWSILDTNILNLQDTIFEFASVIQDGSTGCIDTATLTFQFDTVLNVTLLPGDSTLCINDPVNLLAQITPAGDTAGITYTWYQADTIPIPAFGDTNAIVVMPGDTVEYKVVIDRGGCFDMDSVVINIIPEPVITSLTIVPDTICNTLQDTVDLIAVASTGPTITYQWAGPADSIFEPDSMVTKAIISTVTTFTFTVADTAVNPYCDTVGTVTAYIFPPPTIAAADSGFCAPDLPQSTTITVSGASAQSTYDWSITTAPFDTMINGVTDSSTITVDFDTSHAAGTFTFMVAVYDSATGCPDTLSGPFRIDSGVVTLTAYDDTVCLGNSDTIVATGASIFTWTSVPAATINCLTPPICDTIEIIPTVNTVYTAYGVAGDCYDTVDIPITVIPVSIDAGMGDTICPGDTVFLNATTTGGTNIWRDQNQNGTFLDTTAEDPWYLSHIDSIGRTIGLVLELTDTIGYCPNMYDTAYVVVDSFPDIVSMAVAPDTACSGDTVQLTPGVIGYTTTIWDDGPATGDFIADSATKNAQYTYTVSNHEDVQYVLTAAGSSCPSDLDTINVFWLAELIAECGPDTTICQAASYALTATANGGSILWTDMGMNGTFSDTTTEDPIYTPHPDSSGIPITLFMTVTDTFGHCGSLTDSITIVLDSLPVITSIGAVPDTVCSGDTIQLSSTTNATSVWSWDDGPALGSFVPATTVPNPQYVYAVTSSQDVNLVLTATGSSFCPSDVDTVPVFVIGILTVDAGLDATICQGTTHALNATASGGSFLWTDNGMNGTFSDSTIEDPTYTPHADSVGMTYQLRLTVTDSFGYCGSVYDTMFLTIDSPAVINSSTIVPDTLCSGDTINLGGTVTAASIFAWNDGGAGGTFVPNSTTLNTQYVLTVTNTTPVQFILSVTGSAACPTVMDTLNAVVEEQPTVTLSGIPSAICEGDTLPLSSTSIGDSIAWTHTGTGTLVGPATNNPTYFSAIGDPATITFTATIYTARCGIDTAIATVTVDPKPNVSLTSADTTYCVGTNYVLNASGATNYDWYEIDDLGNWTQITTTTAPLDSIIESQVDTTSYAVIGSTAAGCADTAFITINILPNPVPLGWQPVYDIEECYPLELTMSYTTEPNVSTWNWDMDDGTVITDVNSATHTYQFDLNATYPVVYTVTFTATHTYGSYTCVNSDSMLVEVCEDFFVPNVFTPGDPTHPYFIISGADEFNGCELIVFNRWGVKVFEDVNYQNNWDGKDKNGNLLSSDTFYYVFKCGNESTHTGWIKIINKK
jgi:gliding motility-associated-like protein